MFRIMFILAGFLAITAALLIMQPAQNAGFVVDQPNAQPQLAPANEVAEVARNQQTPLENITMEITRSLQAEQNSRFEQGDVATEEVAQVTDTGNSSVAASPVNEPVQLASLAAPDDMRQMTWHVLREIDRARGTGNRPGAPGSLLHTIINRSMHDGAPQTVQAQDGYLAALRTEAVRAPVRAVDTSQAREYTVLPGDSLRLIAQRHYGDAALYTLVLTANRSELANADVLRPGQTLVLPAH